MSGLTAKIPVQEKIAELERRIMALEKREGISSRPAFGTKWKQLWKHFDEMFEEAFK